MNPKELIKKIIPGFLLRFYHKTLALAANLFYGFPSNKLIVIGVTGTNGKSTTVHLIAKMFEGAGYKVGSTSTVGFKVADKEWLNNKKMTMLGRFALQKLLRQMVQAGCRYTVIETSSQGVEQYRHLGVNYDVAVFTNLTPEHIEAHGGFLNYKNAKGKFFAHLMAKPHKIIGGKKINKVSAVNVDDEYAEYFAGFPADKKYSYSINTSSDIKAENIEAGFEGFRFKVSGNDFKINLPGRFNIYNSLAAVCVGLSQGFGLDTISKSLEKVSGVPGRMEFIDEGQKFRVLVDYAPEPESMRQLYKTIRDSKFINPDSKIIHVLGSAGGGRDRSRRPVLGKLAAENADYVIITNEDPYDEDPRQIINEVAAGAAGKRDGVNLFRILDRSEAIAKAFGLAREGDLVVITGKGSEQAICVAGGKKIPWDDREKVREILRKKS
jgi:UDP-N-acetylmuramoyl-L-alanyl-D-glutamate--2,6-diaminopimelate ligase